MDNKNDPFHKYEVIFSGKDPVPLKRINGKVPPIEEIIKDIEDTVKDNTIVCKIDRMIGSIYDGYRQGEISEKDKDSMLYKLQRTRRFAEKFKGENGYYPRFEINELTFKEEIL